MTQSVDVRVTYLAMFAMLYTQRLPNDAIGFKDEVRRIAAMDTERLLDEAENALWWVGAARPCSVCGEPVGHDVVWPCGRLAVALEKAGAL